MKSLDADKSPLNFFAQDCINYELLEHVKDFKFQTIVHLGSNNGIIDILLCNRYPGINIYAFEPRNEYFTVMKNNLIKSKCENIHLLNNALAHTVGELDMSTMRKMYCDPEDLLDISKDTIVNINNIYHGIRIDDLYMLNCELMILELDAFHKIALCGALKTIDKYKPVILLVYQEDYSGALSERLGIHYSIDTVLKKINYRITKLDDKHSIAVFSDS